MSEWMDYELSLQHKNIILMIHIVWNFIQFILISNYKNEKKIKCFLIVPEFETSTPQGFWKRNPSACPQTKKSLKWHCAFFSHSYPTCTFFLNLQTIFSVENKFHSHNQCIVNIVLSLNKYDYSDNVEMKDY